MLVPLHMEWRDALFTNWAVEPSVVAPHVPDSVSLDTYDGRAWLTVLPFVNADVRPHWFPRGVRIPEVNLRTYVTRERRPAIYFRSLEASDRLTVLGARATHFLPYYVADIDFDRTDGGVRVESRRRHPGARPARFVAECGPDDERVETEPGSLAEFLTERHRYYTVSPSGRLRYADVRHRKWPLYSADATVAENTVFRANSLPDPDGEPVVYYSPGVEVLASPSRRWTDAGRSGAGDSRLPWDPSRTAREIKPHLLGETRSHTREIRRYNRSNKPTVSPTSLYGWCVLT
ncbi:hypothetical protein BRC82_02200 [Halobacteriales archaeon QS_1_67_19]|nr:MAG: hypothetical protein BRC82_02200 [Halobacteriales archaeon QS_1_67_19]